MSEKLDLLIEKFIQSELSEEEAKQLNEWLTGSREARDHYREAIGIHGGLSELFSDELDIPYLNEPEKHRSYTQGIGLAVAATLVLGIGLFFLKSPGPPESDWIAEIVGGAEPEWVTPVTPRFGAGRYQLLSGMVEVKVGGAGIAIEGPADFEFFDSMRMRLYSGRLSAHVLPESIGFVVETPDGKVVDQGTKFGVFVSETSGTEAHLFEGEIDVLNPSRSIRLKESGAVRVAGLEPIESDQLNFPMPGMELPIHWSPGFELNTTVGAGLPTLPGKWSGDLCEVIGTGSFSVEPKTGEGMLRFLKTHSPSIAGSDGQLASELWQLVDLREYSEVVNAGEVSAAVAASFNRLEEAAGHQSTLKLIAFRGEISDAPDYWDRKNDPMSEQLGSSSSNVMTDADPATWETLESKMAVPPGTDFLMIVINTSRRSDHPVLGHFADDIKLTLSARARTSRARNIWIGEGDFEDSTNWLNGKVPDLNAETIVVSGQGEAVVHRSISMKQSIIVALDNHSRGRLRIAKGGQIIKSGFGEVIIGYNRGARAELVVEGALMTRSHVFIGRNNDHSKVTIDGGVWDAGDSLIRMAQYDTEVDTSSELVVRNGGSLSAGTLAMVNDHSSVTIEKGLVEVGRLLVGGNNGEAIVTLKGGTLSAGEIGFGSGKGRIVFESPESRILMIGEHSIEQILESSPNGWWVGDRPASAQNLRAKVANGQTEISIKPGER
ncbi:MAG: hypothetical protein P1U89_15130 [Verrucomicrobiales bacterium]|nr:hypothetical protein [Verrucomicrobiales bacterium]